MFASPVNEWVGHLGYSVPSAHQPARARRLLKHIEGSKATSKLELEQYYLEAARQMDGLIVDTTRSPA